MKNIIKIKKSLLVIIFILINLITNGQNVGINDDGSTPAADAILDIKSSHSNMGLLIPRFTTVRRVAFHPSTESMLVYDTDTHSIWFWNGSDWSDTRADDDNTNELQVLNFSNDTLYLSDGGQIYLGDYTNKWATHGNDIYNTNTRNVGVGLENPNGKLVVQGDSAVSDTLPLFEVKNKDGQTIFAVYDGGVRMYVNDDPTKANNDKGGFAIGGYRLDKTTPDDYLHVFSADTAYVVDTTAQMLWYPLKEAFLSGKVLVESSDSVGQNSWATGYVSKSIGNYSQALGNQARAFGNSSTAIGYHANAVGNNSYAFGNYATAQDSGSYAIGSGASALGLRSFALGSTGVDSLGNATGKTIAHGDYSFAIGMGPLAKGYGSFAIGTKDTTLGAHSVALGYKNKTEKEYGVAIGYLSSANKAKSVAIGSECTANSQWGLAMGFKAEVNTDYGGISIGRETKVSNRYASAIGAYSEASGFFSIAVGYYALAAGQNSAAYGMGKAYGDYSSALGYGSYAYGQASVSLSGTARGKASKSFGTNTIAKSYGELVVGVYNDTTASTNEATWVETDPLFIIGNGYTGGYPYTRHNAVTVLKNGNVGIGTNSALYSLHVVGTSTKGSILIAPNSDLNNDAELLLAEDDDYTYGMSIVYDGGDNQLQVKGKSGLTNYGPWLTISRNDGLVTMPAVYNAAVGTTNRDLYINVV